MTSARYLTLANGIVARLAGKLHLEQPLHARRAQAIEHLLNRLARLWMAKIGNDVGQGRQHERPLSDARMWNREFRVGQNQLVVEEDIDVD